MLGMIQVFIFLITKLIIWLIQYVLSIPYHTGKNGTGKDPLYSSGLSIPVTTVT